MFYITCINTKTWAGMCICVLQCRWRVCQPSVFSDSCRWSQ